MVSELRPWIGARVQKIVQPDPVTLVLELYLGGVGWFLISWDAKFARAHFSTRRPERPPEPFTFATEVRQQLNDSRLTSVEQVGFDRILKLRFDASAGKVVLIAELMGKHSNLIAVDDSGRVAACAKAIGTSKSKRPVLKGYRYEPPPTASAKSVLKAKPGDPLKGLEGASPILVALIESGFPPDTIQAAVREGKYEPNLSSAGAYPLPLSSLGVESHPRPTISLAIEQHMATAITEDRAQHLRDSLIGQLSRVQIAREVALRDLRQAIDTADRSGQLQQMGELILAFGMAMPEGTRILEATDYDGHPIAIRINPELSALENANAYFNKAKKAKRTRPEVAARAQTMEDDLDALQGVMAALVAETRIEKLEELRGLALKRRWLQVQKVAEKPEERPFEGHRVRDVEGPFGFRILYGENATSNDFLTQKVARPNDYWLHVRGQVSAHVVVQTMNQPDRVPPEVLRAAARIAALNSPAKHSSYVAVDATLKKYVRKPRGAPAGTVLYTHEKTIHVHPQD